MNLLITYTLMTGRLWGRVLPKNDHSHFIESLEAYLLEVPRTIRRIHCILDNGSSHIAKDTQAWLAAQAGRVVFHFTPAHASWVNQAELALSAFSRRYLWDRVSASRPELIVYIERALEEYNRFYAHPFTWSFTWHAMHQWYCHRTSAMVHLWEILGERTRNAQVNGSNPFAGSRFCWDETDHSNEIVAVQMLALVGLSFYVSHVGLS